MLLSLGVQKEASGYITFHFLVFAVWLLEKTEIRTFASYIGLPGHIGLRLLFFQKQFFL